MHVVGAQHSHNVSLAAVAQSVEHWLPKPRVAGSSPVCRSIEKRSLCFEGKRGLTSDPFRPFQGVGGVNVKNATQLRGFEPRLPLNEKTTQ